jgi:hypothetical protein
LLFPKGLRRALGAVGRRRRRGRLGHGHGGYIVTEAMNRVSSGAPEPDLPGFSRFGPRTRRPETSI